ncbi:MAG: glycosyltransferase family 39 protein [Acidimicrobiales bacterium]|jgi:4-amino-4-deoxy-L-arabinose transferase-like glycosyltransferase
MLLVITALSVVLTTWRGATYLEGYYAAAVRSMSMSWHNFFFAAFDPAATVSLDKLPGAFWIQALSVRAFGVNAWAIVLPQVLEGACSILVLYRIVRRLSGPMAGLMAAFVMAVSPATVALNRGNISDTLMVLLLLLAADAVVAALTTGRQTNMVLAGLWVGLAFQAKMVEAWLVLPALGLAFMVAAPGNWRRRLIRIGAMAAVAAVVSFSWMSAVTLTAQSTRPYVDGSHNDSLFQQVFVYNGFGRLDQASPNQLLTRAIGIRIPPPPPPGWNRLLTGAFGRDIGWLLPAALIALIAVLVDSRGRPRGDPARATAVLWGTWLLVLTVVFSVGSSINSYYTAALSPAIAGLIGAGSVLAWRRRASIWARLTVAATALVTATYAAWLLPAAGTGLPGWLEPAVLTAGTVMVGAVLVSLWPPARAALLPVSLAASVVAVVLVPSVASVSIAAERLGPFDTPFQPVAVTLGVRAFFTVTSATTRLLPTLEQVRRGAPFLMATQTSALAAPFIFVSGQEVLPIGGYTGTIPEPSLATLESMVHAGAFHLVLQSPSATDPRLVWIARHCLSVPQPKGRGVPSGPRYAIYYCLRGS